MPCVHTQAAAQADRHVLVAPTQAQGDDSSDDEELEEALGAPGSERHHPYVCPEHVVVVIFAADLATGLEEAGAQMWRVRQDVPESEQA